LVRSYCRPKWDGFYLQALVDLLQTDRGRDYLASHNVMISQQDFVDRLQAPVRPDLAVAMGRPGAKPVCSGQQIYVDYRQSVLGKIEVLRKLNENDDLLSFFLWVDTDRTGSDGLMTKFAWPSGRKKGPITILPPGTRDVETRFSLTQSPVLASAADQLWTSLRQTGDRVDGAKQRYQTIRAMFAPPDNLALSHFNLGLTDFLLSSVFGYAPQSLVLSSMLDKDVIVNDIDRFVSRVSEVIRVFNRTVDELIANDINPQVKPLPENYLPLFYSCHDDGRRLRLVREVRGKDHFAQTRCKCGRQYEFHLGRETLSIAELARTDRWSPDVCFPAFFNDLVSGFVAGKSSALYLIVIGAVLREVLGKSPVPILVPQNLDYRADQHGASDSLMYQYLAGVRR